MGRQADANAIVPLPVRGGVAPSYLWLTETLAGGMLRFLVERFPDVDEAILGAPAWRAARWSTAPGQPLQRTARCGAACASGTTASSTAGNPDPV
jgi:hypothetical protein